MQKTQTIHDSLSIQEMALATGLSAHTLRYYERAGLMMQRVERDDGNGYRHYTQQDITWIRFLRCLRATGMPIRDIHRYTELLRQGEETVSERMELLKQHRQSTEEHLHEIEHNLAAINNKINVYEKMLTQEMTDGPSGVDPIIEHVRRYAQGQKRDF